MTQSLLCAFNWNVNAVL